MRFFSPSALVKVLSVLLLTLASCASGTRSDARGVAAPGPRDEEGVKTVRIGRDVQRPGADASPDLEAVERQIIEQTNRFREQEGRAPVKREAKLQAAAEQFAAYMARTNRYGHTADGRQPAERARAAGYDYCLVSENIAYQFSSAGFKAAELSRSFTQGWIDSPGHRENMLEPHVVETGVAVSRSAEGTYYAVQLFGRPESMRVEFKIGNQSGEVVNYTMNGESFELRPRTIRTHGVCTPPELRIGTETLRPRAGADLVVRRRTSGRPVVQER